MKLQQLRYIWEVAHHELNVSATAQSLYTSQPGISKQIRLLEDELGVEIFARSGKHLTHITPAGQEIIDMAGEVLRRVEGIRQAAQEHCDPRRGNLSLAATQTQARYVLPAAIDGFAAHYPDVSLRLHQGPPAAVAQRVADGEVHFGLATLDGAECPGLLLLPCYRWKYAVLVPRNHPLGAVSRITLADLATFPLVTYAAGLGGRARIEEAFATSALQARVVSTATDADVIKTYVRLGLGVGLVAAMVHDPDRDNDLLALDAAHLFRANTTRLVLARGTHLRQYMHDFIASLAPHLDQGRVQQALALRRSAEIEHLFRDVAMPAR